MTATWILLSLLITLPAAGHTNDELDTWVAEWEQRIVTEELDVEQLAEWTDMARRHPAYFGRPVPHRHKPATTTRRYQGDVEQWRPLIATYFNASDVETALRIIACESGGNPNADNPRSSASGLWQHLARYWPQRSAAAGIPGASIWDPAASTIVAAHLRYHTTAGFQHWECW
jgi:hypothetical protein